MNTTFKKILGYILWIIFLFVCSYVCQSVPTNLKYIQGFFTGCLSLLFLTIIDNIDDEDNE